MKAPQGLEKITLEVARVFAEIQRICEELPHRDTIDIEVEINKGESCILRAGPLGTIVRWEQQYRNTFDENTGLHVEQYRGWLLLNRELGHRVQLKRPTRLNRVRYEPDLSLAREYGWRLPGKVPVFFSSIALAEKCVLQLMDLIGKDDQHDGAFDLDIKWPT
jgi:hypothetical protein